MNEQRPPQGLPVYLTGEEACPYLPPRPSRNAFVDPSAPLSSELYDQLLGLGLRRSGGFVYRPFCPGCSACESLRIPVAAFRPRRWQRRIRRAGARFELQITPGGYEPRHFALFRRYLDARHPGGGMEHTTPEQYHRFVFADWCDTELLELWDGVNLVAVAVTDCLPNSLSAVYTFFAPEYAGFSPGTLAILHQIERAQELGRAWLYLGYWIGEARNMRYKSGFMPHERLGADGRWRRFDASGAEPGA